MNSNSDSLCSSEKARIYAASFLADERSGNLLLDLHPFTKFYLLAVLSLSAVIVPYPLYGFIVSIVFVILSAISTMFRPFMKIFWKISVFFVLLLFLMRTFFTRGNEVIFKWAGFIITKEGIQIGLRSASLVLCLSGAFVLFMTITPMRSVFLALEKVGFSKVATYIILSSLQSIEDLKKQSKVILDAQKARGIETEGNIIVRLKAFFPTLGPIIISSFVSAEEKAIAMEARAFSSQCSHTNLRSIPRMSIPEKITCVFFTISFLFLVIWRIVK